MSLVLIDTLTISFLIICFLLSCGNKKVDNNETVSEIDSSIVILPLGVSTVDAISHLDSLVSFYNSESRHEFPFDSLKTKPSLLELRTNNEDTLKYYLTLLLIKKYKYHIECCNQGYELRNQNSNKTVGIDTLADPMLYEFLRFSESFEDIGLPVNSLLNNRVEFMNSGIIMDWLNKETKYLQSDSIKSYYNYVIKNRLK